VRLGVGAAVVLGELLPGDVEVEDGRVAAVGLETQGTGTAIPGFVDLQVNGYGGIDLLTEPERWQEVDAMLASGRSSLAAAPTSSSSTKSFRSLACCERE
jgi:N-acetylglucosamine-6-phosphate deacetylase